MEGHRFARPSRGGGLIPRATAGLDRWLSRQNPAYRPALPKAPHHTDGVLLALFTLYCSLFTCHVQNTVASTIEEVGGGHWPPALSAPTGHLSHRARQVALIRLALAGDARATFTLWSNCHWQLLDFDSLRGAPPRRGRLWVRIVTGGNPWKGPHQRCDAGSQ